MPKALIVSSLLFLFASVAVAQSGNVFFGYSYYNTSISQLSRSSANGWEGSLEVKVFPLLGVVADFDGHYGSPDYSTFCSLCNTPTSASMNTPQYNVLFGPRVSASLGRFRPYGEVLFGLGHAAISGFSNSSTSFATGVGGGLDYRIARPIAWRFQGDYIHTSLYSLTQDNVRISTGIVLRF